MSPNNFDVSQSALFYSKFPSEVVAIEFEDVFHFNSLVTSFKRIADNAYRAYSSSFHFSKVSAFRFPKSKFVFEGLNCLSLGGVMIHLSFCLPDDGLEDLH